MVRLTLLLLFIAVAGCTQAEQSRPEGASNERLAEPDLDAIIDPVIAAAMDEERVPGAAVIVVRDGQTIFKKGYGLADVETGTPVDPDETVFRIGSITKALTGLALTRQVDQGRVDYDTDIAPYADGMDNTGDFTRPVTVRHLLTHTGGFDQIGLDRQIREFDKPLSERKAMRHDLKSFLADGNLRRVAPPGVYMTYDTYGISLAGQVMADIVGTSYADAMQTELFVPLGMRASWVEVPPADADRLATGYGFVEGEYVPQPYEVYLTPPASSIDATPADMGRLLEALTGGGANAHGRLLGEAAAQRVLSPQFRPHEYFLGITHGFWEEPISFEGGEARAVFHGGSMLGYTSLMMVFPEAKVGVFVTANRHPEAGGGPVRLDWKATKAIAAALVAPEPLMERLPYAPIDKEGSLDEYTGNYYHTIHCKTCSAAERARGAWPRGGPATVAETQEGLVIVEELFLPSGEPDLFVAADGSRMVYFSRNDEGSVIAFNYSSAADSFARIAEGADAP